MSEIQRERRIIGRFQPLVRLTTRAVAYALTKSKTPIRVYVDVPEIRSVNSPFGLGEIFRMWSAVFPEEVANGTIRIVKTPPGKRSPPMGSLPADPLEKEARDEMSCTDPRFAPSIDFMVGEEIAKFPNDWKRLIKV